MTEVTCCLLCLNSCSDYKCLYDADGVYDMELYNITVKYFNTMYLTETNKNELPVVCFKCWQCMSEFNQFQSLIIMAHEKLSKDRLKLSLETDGVQRANRNKSLSELEQMDEGFMKMEDSSQLLQVGGQQKANPNESPTELGLMDERSIKMEITTEPTCISSVGKITANYIEPSTHVKGEPAENLSCDENSQSANMTDIHSDLGGCEEIPKPEVLLSGDETDDNSLLQQSTLRNPEQHSSTDDIAGSQTQLISRSTKKQKKIYTTSQELDETISKWKSSFKCAICKDVVPNFTLLRSHTKQKHPKMKCQISCCKRLHMGPSIIAEHAIFHMDPQSFKCRLCSKPFKSSENLSRHRIQVHSIPNAVSSGAPQYKCRICEKLYVRKDDLEEHEANHLGIEMYTCLLCSKSFKYRTLIYRHNRKSHPTEWLNRKGKTSSMYTKVNLDDVTKSLYNFPSTS